MNTGKITNTFSTASALTILALLPAWVDFWWRQRRWAPKEVVLIGGPLIVLLGVALGALAWRRGERAGRLATLGALLLPLAVFIWMNFVGNP